MFIYKKMYIKHLVSDGYKAKSATQDIDYLQQRLNMELPRLEKS